MLEMMSVIGVASSPYFAIAWAISRRWLARKEAGESANCGSERNALLAFLNRVAIALTAIMLLAGLLFVAFDLARVQYLRQEIGQLVDADIATIKAALGEPNFKFEHANDSARWLYCSRFDWDGVRSRWNDSPYLLYWFTRLDFKRDSDHDAVIELVLKDGKLVTIENSVRDDLIGRYPILSF